MEFTFKSVPVVGPGLMTPTDRSILLVGVVLLVISE